MQTTLQGQRDARDNNFNLLRFLAALAVIYDHSFTVVHGMEVNWLIPTISTSHFGWYAVNVFFILSGFLITKSWLSRKDIVAFAVARSLRLFPALILGAVLTAFVLGPILAACTVPHYFSEKEAWLYVPFTATLISPSEHLPHLFEALPADMIVNNPLWTLRYEAVSYMALAGLGIAGLLRSRKRAILAVAFVFATYLAIAFLTDWRAHSGFLDSLMRFWLCFFLGVTAYILIDRIAFHIPLAIALGSIALATHGTPLFELTFHIALTYAVLWFGYVPGGILRRFNRIGDYSYGLYIFAWPLQQTAVLLAPDLSPHLVFVIVTPVVMSIAALSWHFVEKPALRSQGRVMSLIQRNTDGGRPKALAQG